MARHKKTFTVGWLYPDLMNIYGDRGNILTLLKRAEEHARSQGARLLKIGVHAPNKVARDLYISDGFQERIVILHKELPT